MWKRKGKMTMMNREEEKKRRLDVRKSKKTKTRRTKGDKEERQNPHKGIPEIRPTEETKKRKKKKQKDRKCYQEVEKGGGGEGMKIIPSLPQPPFPPLPRSLLLDFLQPINYHFFRYSSTVMFFFSPTTPTHLPSLTALTHMGLFL